MVSSLVTEEIMKRTRGILQALILMVVSVFLFFNLAQSKTIKQSINRQGYNEITAEGITLQWKISGSFLEVVLSAPTDGWVAVGFDPTSLMKDANIIIGFVKDGTPVVRDDFGSWYTSHDADESQGGSNDVVIRSGSESGKKTEFSFALPLDSGDPLDRTLVEGKTYTVILAYGTVDDFTTRHKKRTSVEITL